MFVEWFEGTLTSTLHNAHDLFVGKSASIEIPLCGRADPGHHRRSKSLLHAAQQEGIQRIAVVSLLKADVMAELDQVRFRISQWQGLRTRWQTVMRLQGGEKLVH